MVEKNLNNTAYAIGKSIKSSQQKANLVLRSIRVLPIENAVNILQFSRRRISNIILKIPSPPKKIAKKSGMKIMNKIPVTFL